MTTLANTNGHPPAATPAVDPARWPGVAHVPAGGVRARVAHALFRRAVAAAPLRVEYPDGTVLGAGDSPNVPRMVIHRPQDFAARLGAGGLIGFGEAYMAGDWAASDLTAVLEVFAARVATLVPASLQAARALAVKRQPRGERNSTRNTRSNIARHYDLSNDFFALWLDETMTYSSALFTDPADATFADLADAQRRKVDRLLDAAGVGPGTRLLEIGTGWGELAIRAAQRGATVRTVTLSQEQRELARHRVADLGLDGSVTIDLLDYRLVEGQYDAVVSVEMIEAVGHQYWPAYFRKIDQVLAPGGVAAIQAITMPHKRMRATRNTYTWIHKYIFPGGLLPSVEAIEQVTRKHTTLRVTDDLSFGRHYARTLRLWAQRFEGRAAQVADLGFDAVFRRMWDFYLCYSEAGFASGYLDVRQLVFKRD